MNLMKLGFTTRDYTVSASFMVIGALAAAMVTGRR